MKTKFFSFFAASAMMLAASCSSTDVEESLLPEESVKGECLTVNVEVPSGDLSMSRADIPDGWGLRCMVYLVYLDQDGNIVLDESNRKAKMKVLSEMYTGDASLRFTGVEPGKYAICGFCSYVKDGDTSLDVKVPYEFSHVGNVNGIYPQFPVSMNSKADDGSIINFNNDLYDCWKGKVDFEKTDINASVSLPLKRAVNMVRFSQTNGSEPDAYGSQSLAGLKVVCLQYNTYINLWSDEVINSFNSIRFSIEDFTGLPNWNLGSLYLPKQNYSIGFSLTPTAKPELDVEFKAVTVSSLTFDKANVKYNLQGNYLVETGANVNVNVTMEDEWGQNITSYPEPEYSNP